MSSQPRPCYQELSQYSKNGINPINAPFPSETKPQLFSHFTTHKFGQEGYKIHKMRYGSAPQAVNNCTNYSILSNIKCASDDSEYMSNKVLNDQYEFYPGFNEIGMRRPR